MAKFLKLIKDDERFTYTPEGLEDVAIVYRRLSGDAMNDINRRYEITDYRRGQRQKYIPDDKRIEVNRDIWDYIVLEWTNVSFDGVAPAECTRGNKWQLPGKTKTDLLELADADNVSELRAGAERGNS